MFQSVPHADAADDCLYSLDVRPWVPVADEAARTTRVGLRDLFRGAHETSGLAVVTPPAAAALLRVLTAMTARITRLDQAHEGPDDWTARRNGLLDAGSFAPESVEAYFDSHSDGLRLYDPDRPFLQDPRLGTQSATTSGINKLVLARPSGNNQVFFGHFTDADPIPVPSADAVLHLLAQLYYGASGQCTPRTVDGRRFGNTMAGPLRRVLSCHPLATNLFRTLILGVPGPDTWPDAGPAEDVCPWERGLLPHPLTAPEAPGGLMSVLTNRHQHAVWLQPSPDGSAAVDATITWAHRDGHPPARDPYLIWEQAKDGSRHPRRADASRSLWRDLDRILLSDGRRNSRRPLIVDTLSALPRPALDGLRFVTHGFDQDGQTRNRSHFTRISPPVGDLIASAGEPDAALSAVGTRQAREAAEKAAWHLQTALGSAWSAFAVPGRGNEAGGRGRQATGPWTEAGSRLYWTAAEDVFADLLRTSDVSAALHGFSRLAVDTFDRITAPTGGQPRGAMARAQARGLVHCLLTDGS
ncbi:type I-E CRISPR-associated protein Cse1/CasA [Streptomyces zhihengii]|uniref:type I-E CRISPR-associated protein Cse1/CasA n=1 Tax=Streptomyces zhihengii TaxID=1818004 RepID=UPI0033B9125C